MTPFEKFKQYEFVGEALLHFIVARLLVQKGIHRNVIQRVCSNENLKICNDFVGLGENINDLTESKTKRLANNYEYEVYRQFAEGDLPQAESFVKNSLMRLFEEKIITA